MVVIIYILFACALTDCIQMMDTLETAIIYCNDGGRMCLYSCVETTELNF